MLPSLFESCESNSHSLLLIIAAKHLWVALNSWNALYVCYGNAPTSWIKGNEKFTLLVRIMDFTKQAISPQYPAVTLQLEYTVHKFS